MFTCLHQTKIVPTMMRIVYVALVIAASARLQTNWEPEPCSEQPEGVPCVKLYKHPQGSGVVMPCPAAEQSAPESCAQLFKGKEDGTQCPQIDCPKALGVTMKLVCAGGCCPSCWAPDHVVKIDRHVALKNADTVPPSPLAPPSCKGVKCFEPVCNKGYKKGFNQGDCCYSCVVA